MSPPRRDPPDGIERHDAGYDWRKRLEEVRALGHGEGERTYAAVGNGAFWIVHDASTFADIFEDDDEVWNGLVTLERYDDEAGWTEATDALGGEQRRRDLCERFSRHPYADLRIDVISQGPRGSHHRRLPLGQVWRARENHSVIVLEAAPENPDWVPFVQLLDEFGLVSLGTHGMIPGNNLRANYILVSDPEEVADSVKRGREERGY